jgi:Family of unknown function (DUF6478)
MWIEVQDMAKGGLGAFGWLLHQRSMQRWSAAVRKAQSAELATLRVDRQNARSLRHKLDELIFVADTRLGLPRIGSTAFPRPGGTDWAWRPKVWRGPLAQKGIAAVESKTPLGDEITVFHDCRITELSLRQTRNTREADLAPFALRMDVFRFDGSFLSLAIDLPKAACEGLKKRHLIRLDAIVELEKPLEILARLNIKHGPNTEQIVRELPLQDRDVFVEFDLAYTNLNEKRVDGMWLDLIFEGPQMNQVTLRDLTFSRYPRADI